MLKRFVLALLLAVAPALGCPCIVPAKNEMDWVVKDCQRYPLIFEAVVEDAQTRSHFRDAPFATLLEFLKTGRAEIGEYSLYTLRVVRLYKGKLPSRIQLKSVLTEGSCAYRFTVRRRYLVYAWPKAGGLVDTDICTRTAPIETRASDVAYLSRTKV